MSTPSVAVIGAGVIGIAIARSLSRAGASVTVFERQHLGAGTSSATFAWVNSNGKNPESYHELNIRGLREHEELQASDRTEARWFIQTGTYEWAVDETAKQRLSARVARLQERGYPVELETAEHLMQRIPELRIDARAGEIWSFPNEGYIWPQILLARLWSEARENGCRLCAPVDVVDVVEQPDGVRLELSTGETWTGDYAISATGRWSESIMKLLGIEFAMIDANQANKIACGFLGYTNPQYVQLRSNLITPEMNVRPDGGGRLLVQTPDLDHRADPAYQADPTGLVGQEMVRRLQRVFNLQGSTRIERLAVGQRSRPADGLPAAGFATDGQRVYVVATHSGITLAPLLGTLVAEEIMAGERSPLLADYSPDRLIGKKVEDFPAFSTIHFAAAQ